MNYVNDKSIVIHRVNECDERKGTDFVNDYLVGVNKSADYTIFVSTWLMQLFEREGLNLVINNEIIPIEIIVKLTTLLIDKKKCNNKIMKPNIKYPAIMIKNKSLSFLWL